MPQAFTPEQSEHIRQLLFESACRHAATCGFRKTSLEALTADAGISKSSFYKFYESKELLFGEVGLHMESAIIRRMEEVLKDTQGQDNRVRAATAVNAAFDMLNQWGIVRFLSEDFPLLKSLLSRDEAREHFLSMASSILQTLKREKIRFNVSDETIEGVINILYLSTLPIHEVEGFPVALRELVPGACERLVA